MVMSNTSLSWLRLEERLTASLLVVIRNINVFEIPNSLNSQFTNTLTPPDMSPGFFSGPEQIQGNVQYYTEP